MNATDQIKDAINSATSTLMVSVPYTALVELLERSQAPCTQQVATVAAPQAIAESVADSKPSTSRRDVNMGLRKGTTEEGAFCAVLADGGTFREAMDQTDGWTDSKGRGKAGVFRENIKAMRGMNPAQRRDHLTEYFGWGKR